MIETYNTILQEGQDEIVEKKSRFIGYAVPVSSEEEAYALLRRSGSSTMMQGTTAMHLP